MHVPHRAAQAAALLASLLLLQACFDEQDYYPLIPEPVVRAWALTSLEPPAGYYDGADTSNGAALRASLHEAIDDHSRYPFTSTGTDTWNILELADEDPADTSRILDVYRNASYPKYGEGNPYYNREHAWPSSFGFPDDVSSNVPFSDCHALFLVDDGYNSSRSNKPYRYCADGCSENPTDVNNGRGGTLGAYPGESNWTTGSLDTGTWETWLGRRGDVARALLYLDVRYEGGNHGVSGHPEPDLILTDDQGLISASQTGSNASVAYMGVRSAVLQWHLEDPVDDVERYRNAVVATYQGNRNPFVDHPEWVACVFSDACGGDPAPGAPTGLVATGGTSSVELDWDDNSEPDLAGYNIYRATSATGPWASLNGPLVTTSAYSDASATAGTWWFYVVTAVDAAGGESARVNVVSAQLDDGSSGAGLPWINEIHYDNDGVDTGELIEVAGPAGLDLTGWQLLGYNGNDGRVYKAVDLAGVLPDQGGCVGALSFAFSSLQNGSPDAIALVDELGEVVEFISYEGTVVATDGPASGASSYDIGVSESTSTPVGWSLQLSGTGAAAIDFVWGWPQAQTPGAPNVGQTFDGCAGCETASDCDDADLCNGAETCDGGSCNGGPALVCDDGDVCTLDGCDPATGCVSSPVSCDDGDACTADGCDPATGCVSAAISCDDGDACTADGCDPAIGCVSTPPSCGAADGCCVEGCGDPDCATSVCGDDVCGGGGEDCRSCPGDCRCVGPDCAKGCCGDGACSGNENASKCPVDCGG